MSRKKLRDMKLDFIFYLKYMILIGQSQHSKIITTKPWQT